MKESDFAVVALYDRWSFDKCLDLTEVELEAALPSVRPSCRQLVLVAILPGEPSKDEVSRLLDASREDMDASDGRHRLVGCASLSQRQWEELAGARAGDLEGACGSLGSTPQPTIRRLTGAGLVRELLVGPYAALQPYDAHR